MAGRRQLHSYVNKGKCITLFSSSTHSCGLIHSHPTNLLSLLQTFDFTKVMCVQYWPASREKDETYEDLHIGIIEEEELANYCVRTFRIYKLNEKHVSEALELS